MNRSYRQNIVRRHYQREAYLARNNYGMPVKRKAHSAECSPIQEMPREYTPTVAITPSAEVKSFPDIPTPKVSPQPAVFVYTRSQVQSPQQGPRRVEKIDDLWSGIGPKPDYKRQRFKPGRKSVIDMDYDHNSRIETLLQMIAWKEANHFVGYPSGYPAFA